VLCVTTVAAGIASCTRGPPPAEGENISCSSWHREALPGSDAVIVNNTWNAQWANGKPYSQCLRRRMHDGVVQYGWKWSWPQYRPYTSYAAPEAVFGWTPWGGDPSTSPLLPARIDALRSLKVDYAVNLGAKGRYNLNTTMWIVHKVPASPQRDPSSIRGELMVWFAHEPRGFAGLESDGSVALGDLTFDVWHKRNHGDDSGTTQQRWTMIIYVNRENSLSRNFDLKLILDDAARKGLVDPAHAVGGVELITEIFGGSGELWLERFRVTPATTRPLPPA
jgi:hypothetical protein